VRGNKSASISAESGDQFRGTSQSPDRVHKLLDVFRLDTQARFSALDERGRFALDAADDCAARTHQLKELRREHLRKNWQLLQGYKTYIACPIECKQGFAWLLTKEGHIAELQLSRQPFELLLFGSLADEEKVNGVVTSKYLRRT